MMRWHIKRLAMVIAGGLSMTLLMLVLPSPDAEQEIIVDPASEKPKFKDFNPSKSRRKPLVYPRDKPIRALQNPPHVSPLRDPLDKYPAKQEAFQPPDPSGAFAPKLDGRVTDKRLILALQEFMKPWDGVDVAPLECTHRETLGQYWLRRHQREWPGQNQNSWDKFYSEIGSCDMYRPKDSQVVQDLLRDMATLPVKHVAIMEGGTQVKLLITFENGKQAVFKPMRFGRQYETDPNHFYFSDFERHFAELASYHLDKVLGLGHSVPLTGRVFNISSELRDKAEKALAKTFFTSPAGNLCFVSKCDYYCDTTHAICGAPDLKEGSLQVLLPDDEIVPREHTRSPYRRTYSKKHQLAAWQKEPNYCNEKVKRKYGFAHGRRLLDLIELYVFDFLTGNQDRHHFEAFGVFDDYPAYMVFLDNGRGFGRSNQDDMSILAPLWQCCVIRPSLLRTLLGYYSGRDGESLSEALYRSMALDPVAPILAPKHFTAIERRLEIILRTVLECIRKNGGDPKNVIMTQYHNPDVPENGGDEDEEEEDEKKK